MGHKCCTITLVIFALLLLILAGLILIAFPLAFYPSLLKSKIPIEQDSDGQFTKSGFYWSHPPADTDYFFRIFNIDNPDDITFFGDKPKVTERGPYRWREQDKRHVIGFLSDNKEINYTMTKTYVYTQDGSCSNCSYNDIITVPNFSIVGLARSLFENPDLPPSKLTLADATTLLLGLYPFTRVKMSELLYVGYTDALLDFLNSDFKKDLESVFGNLLGFDPPNIKLLGYFAQYNGTHDGDYISFTGQSEYQKTGLIKSWMNNTHLPFWKTNETNDISGTTDGAVSGSFINKDSLNLFQSFLCRHLKLNFDSEETVEGIKSYKFVLDIQNFNPYAPGFEGYSFDNEEGIDYFPTWNSTGFVNNDTNTPLPPGVVQQKCLPGKLDSIPFTAFLSAPHFLYAPPEVQDSITGLKADQEKHALGEFSIQPKLGSALRATVRTQLNIAVYMNELITSLSHSSSALIPGFWLETKVKLRPYAYKFIKFSTVTIPNIALYTGIGVAVLAGLCVILIIVLTIVWRRKSKTQSSTL